MRLELLGEMLHPRAAYIFMLYTSTTLTATDCVHQSVFMHIPYLHLHVNTHMLHASACVFCSNMHVLYIWRHLWISTSFILVIIKWNSGGSFNYQSMKPNQLFLIIKSSLRNLIGWRFRDNDLRSLCDLLFFLLGSRDLVSCLSCLLVLYCYASKPLWRNFADRQCTSVSWHPETVYGFYFNSLVQCKAKLLHKENFW